MPAALRVLVRSSARRAAPRGRRRSRPGRALLLAVAGAAYAGAARARERRLAERRRHPRRSTGSSSPSALVIFVRRRGRCCSTRCVKFRARKGAVAAQIHGNTRLEVGWTVGAALILVVIAIVTFLKLGDIREPAELRAPTASRSRSDGTFVAAGAKQRLPAQRQVAEHPRQRPAVHLALHVSATATPTTSTTSSPTRRWSSRSTRPSRSTSAPRTSPTPGGSRSSAASSTPSRATRTTPGSRSRRSRRAVASRGQCAELCGRNHANMIAQVRARRRRRVRALVRAQKAGDRRRRQGRRRQAQRADRGGRDQGRGPRETRLDPWPPPERPAARAPAASRRSSPHDGRAASRRGWTSLAHDDRPQADRDHVHGPRRSPSSWSAASRRC